MALPRWDDGDGDSAKAIPQNPPRDIKVGDRVQWVSQDMEQFDVPRAVTEVFRDPARGWFVSVRGEKGSLPMEQIEVAERGAPQQQREQGRVESASPAQPIEVFLTSGGRLQITADVDRAGVDTLMTPYEYALGLISILMSLALADIVVSFHRLIRSRAVVYWDGGRILVAAALVMLEIIRMWFAQWTGKDVAIAVTFGVYLGEFLQILLLVLLAYASLPDDVGEQCDLKDFYEKNRRYFWLVFSAYQATYVLLWLTVFGGTQASVGGPVTAVDWFRMLGPLAVYLLLAFARVRWLDYAAPTLVIVFYLLRYWNQSLAS